MKNEPASNIIPSIYIIGILILNTWGNGWVVMFFSVAGLPFLFWLMPVEMRKPILKVALASGIIAIFLSLAVVIHGKLH